MALLGSSAFAVDYGAAGGGGFITTIHITSDNKVQCTGDVWGASDWDEATSSWEQVVRSDTMPSGDYGPSKPANSGLVDNPGGFFYVRANADSTRSYLMWNAFFYYRDGSGAFTRSSMPARKALTNSGVARLFQGRCVTDPLDKNKVLFGTMNDCRYSLTGGLDGCPAVSGIGAPANVGGAAAMNLVAVKADGSQWAIFEQGVGAKTSSTVNGTYTLISGSPTTCMDFFYDTAGDLHVVAYTTEQATNNWNYWNGTTWTRPTLPNGAANPVATVAVDPVNNGAGICQTVSCMGGSGQLILTLNKGSTWVGADTWNLTYPSPIGIYMNSTDHPWKAGNKNAFPSGMKYAPSGSNRLWVADGVGCRRSTNPTTFSRWDWYDASKAKTGNVGLAMWVCNHTVTIPGTAPGRNFQFKWDYPFWDIADVTKVVNPIYPNASGLTHGWQGDYASNDTTFLACAFSYNGDYRGYYNTATKTFTRSTTGLTTMVGGTLAWSDKNRGIMIGGNDAKSEFTRDAMATWNILTFGGEQLDHLHGVYWTIRGGVTADKTTPGTFYVLIPTNNNGSVPSNFSGLWRKVIGLASDGSGDSELRLYAAPLVAGWTDSSTHQPTIKCVPGSTGKILMSAGIYAPAGHQFYVFQDTGSSATRTAVTNVTDVSFFGFGKGPRGQTYPSVFIKGKVSGTDGVWWSSDNMASWTKFTDYPLNHVDNISAIDGDMNIFGRCYIGYQGSNQIVVNFAKTVTLS